MTSFSLPGDNPWICSVICVDFFAVISKGKSYTFSAIVEDVQAGGILRPG